MAENKWVTGVITFLRISFYSSGCYLDVTIYLHTYIYYRMIVNDRTYSICGVMDPYLVTGDGAHFVNDATHVPCCFEPRW